MFNWLASTQETLPNALMLNGQSIPLAVSRHHNAKRLTLRYDAQRRQIRLTLPPRAPMRLAASFLREKEAWLSAQIIRHPKPVAFAHGAILPVLGNSIMLHHTESLRGHATLADGILTIPCPEEALPKRTEEWLKAQLRTEILREATGMAAALGLTFRRVSLRDTSSRWGSCSSAGNLSFCWRLVFAPRAVLSYLVAHEVAHLQEMNHSPAFWALVAQLQPDYQTRRNWLTQNASALHRYGA
jgi:predicted metal-dependent hydrolase